MTLIVKDRARPVLVYILGWGRSGSTVLANVLGSLNGAASMGEARFVWDRGIARDGICGCGEVFHDCALWPDLTYAGRRLGDFTGDEAMRIARAIGARAVPRQAAALHVPATRRRYLERRAGLIADLEALYAEFAERSGARLLVDAGKSPFYAVNLLGFGARVDVRFLHLVRDPRAVVHSWRRKRMRRDFVKDERFPRPGLPAAAVLWRMFNAESERLGAIADWPMARISYEDFVADWRSAIAGAFPDIFSKSSDTTPLDQADVTPQHSISGNPARFSTGAVRLRPDEEWREAMRPWQQNLVWSICGGMARRYGYRRES